MPEKSFEARVAAIEAQMAGKTLETHFREHAELIDRVFIYRFEEFDKKWDGRLTAGLAGLEERTDGTLVGLEKRIDVKLSQFEERFDSKLARLEERFDAKLEVKLEPLRADLKILKDAVLVLVARLPGGS